MTRQGARIRCPENVLGWIPWYAESDADGESLLTPRQRGAVQAHAAQCSDCRAEIDMISGAPFEIDVELPDPDRLFEEISARIAAEEASQAESSATRVIPIDRARRLDEQDYGKIASWLEESGADEIDPADDASARGEWVVGPWQARPVWAAAAALVLLLLGGVGGALWSESNDVYRTASAPPARAGARVDVVFRGDASLQQISDALRAAGAEIVEGPSAAGVYRLRPVVFEVAEGAASGAAHAVALAERLKAGKAPVVLFAEAVRAP